MILCPECDHGLKLLDQEVSGDRLKCDHCGNIVVRQDGIFRFHPGDAADFDQHSQEALTAIMDSEGRHFWFATRAEFLARQLRRFVRSDASFADIGAGSGEIAAKIASWCSDVSAADIQTAGLLRARDRGIVNLYQINLERRSFVEHFDAVGAFDVLEHFAEDAAIVSRLWTMLKPGGHLFATVPASSRLWNKRDVLENHKRRYDRGQLERVLDENGFRLTESRYFFVSILPLLILRSLRHRVLPSEIRDGEHMQNIRINTLINTILRWITKAENRVFACFKPPIGGSLFVVARKIPGANRG